MARNYQRSCLKWAGGKYRLLPFILPHLPAGKRLCEPFLGSGVIFLNTNYEEYYLSDMNADLINFYKTIQSAGDIFIRDTAKLFNGKYNHTEKYYQIRKKFNACEDIYERSRLFLYLNRHCFNGLCRYNQKLEFNVPFGTYDKPYFPAEELALFHEKSKKATFVTQDFAHTIKNCRKGDVIYCDPPYVPLSDTAYFTQYIQSEFSFEQQTALSQLANTLQAKDIPILISNHYTPVTKQLYNSANIITFNVTRTISGQVNNRKIVKELLAIY